MLPRQRISVPNFDGVVSQPGNNFSVIVLETVDTLGVLRPAVDALKVVLAAPPVVLNGIDVLDDGGVQSPIKIVGRVMLACKKLNLLTILLGAGKVHIMEN